MKMKPVACEPLSPGDCKLQLLLLSPRSPPLRQIRLSYLQDNLTVRGDANTTRWL